MTESAFLVGTLATAAFAVIVCRPLLGACLFLLANPLIVGLARGQIGVVLRPNGALLLFIFAAQGVRVMLMLCGRYRPTPFDHMDVALLGLVATGSAMPVLWQAVRNLPLSADDLLYAAVLVKYYALFRFFRGAVVDDADTATCLRVSLCAAALVAVVVILQVSSLFGVPEFLLFYYDSPFEGYEGVLTSRTASTVASSFGLGDLMIINLTAALALMRVAAHGRWLLAAARILFLSGCVVAGSISCYLGLAIALLAFGVLTGNLQRLALAAVAAMAAMAVAALAFWPVIENRLEGFARPSGLPFSWEGRMANLERLFLPKLLSDNNWLPGMRPASRVPAPEAWRSMVYIESGYVWLLWIGSIPFLLAYFWLTAFTLRHLGRVTPVRADAVECAATTGFCLAIVSAVLMLFDPHLTVRGGADIFFPMLALAVASRFVPQAACAPAGAMPHRYASVGEQKTLVCKQ